MTFYECWEWILKGEFTEPKERLIQFKVISENLEKEKKENEDTKEYNI